MSAQNKGGEFAAIEVQAVLREHEPTPKCGATAAFAFSGGGHLLDRARLKEGRAILKVPAEQAQSVRVMVGPEIEDDEPRISALQRRGAVERLLRLDLDPHPKLEFEILPNHWKVWWQTCCVPGQLLKRTEVDGVTADLPVCHATVEVYEVDPVPLLVRKLPDLAIKEIREWILDPAFPDPPFPPVRLEGPQEFRPAPDQLRQVAASSSLTSLRAELVVHPDWTRWILCLRYPSRVRMDKICETKTDACGRFSCCFFKGFLTLDTPDLYFKAKQKFFGGWPITIYEPKPVHCNTRWNYQCGTEVTLYTTSYFANTCPPCPPVEAPLNWAMFTAIGNLSLDGVHGTSESLESATTAANRGLTGTGRPFGGRLRPRLEFDHSLRNLGVRYYRISWRLGTSGAWAELNSTVHRHYSHEVGDELILEPYTLGPNAVNDVANLFEIPPAVPPKGQWTVPDAVLDTQSGVLDTQAGAASLGLTALQAAGKYQIKVELFDASGDHVDLNNVGGQQIIWVVPDVPALDDTITTTPAANLGLVVGDAFVMTVHIDNNPCTAKLDDPAINGTLADDECGVLEYGVLGGTVQLGYSVIHPNGFATRDFTLKRGATTLTSLSVSGAAGTGNFSVSVSTDELRAGCPTAGFAETLWARTTATTGWGRVGDLDGFEARAFVLTPTPPTP